MEKRVITEQKLKDYCGWLWENEKSSGTIRKYNYYLEQFSVFMQGKEVTRGAVLRWKELMRKRLRTVTVNGAVAALNGFFKYRGWNDCVTRFFKVSRQVFCSEQRELEKSEYVRLVQKAQELGDERMALLLQTIAATGIRISELPFITAEAVEAGWAEVECKGRVRRVFLPNDLCACLKDYMRRQGIRTGWVFITRTGSPMDRSNIWRAMKRLGRQCGIAESKVFPHNLRHLFARIFYSKKQDLGRLSDILGHANINTTRIYLLESGKNHVKLLESMDMLVRNNRIPLLLYHQAITLLDYSIRS